MQSKASLQKWKWECHLEGCGSASLGYTVKQREKRSTIQQGGRKETIQVSSEFHTYALAHAAHTRRILINN